MKNEQPERLIRNYFDDLATDNEVAKLNALLSDNPEIADEFVGVQRIESLLHEYFTDLHSTHEVEEILGSVANRAIPRVATLSVTPAEKIATLKIQGTAHRPSGRVPWLITVIVMLAVGIGLFAVIQPSNDSRVVAGEVHQVVSGRVAVDGVAALQVPSGSRIEVLSDSDAVIRLADGSVAEFAPSSRAVIRGRRDQVRQVIELEHGRGDFQVKQAEGTFRVDTPVGSVTALGTEFSVELQPESMGATVVNNPVAMGLVVAVLAGNVEVDYEGNRYELALGEDRVFEKSPKPAKPKPDQSGVVVKVSDDGASFTIKQAAKQKGKPSIVTEIEIDDATKVSYVNVTKGQKKPTLGYSATVWFAIGSQSRAAAVRFVAKESVSKTPGVTGRVSAVSKNGKQFTLNISKKGKTLRERQVTINDRTKLSFGYVPIDGKQPAVGYNAAVWFENDDSNVATVVKFTGSKAHRPDYFGRVTAVSEKGDSITLSYRVKKKGPERTTTVRIADSTKLVYTSVDKQSQRPTVGFTATVWIDKKSQNLASGIEFFQAKKKLAKKKPPKSLPSKSGKAKLSGRIVEVSDKGQSLTVLLDSTKKGSPAKLEIKLNQNTNLTFKGMPDDEQQPTVGYQVSVVLVPGKGNIAELLNFSMAGLMPFPKSVSLTAAQKKQLWSLRLEYSQKMRAIQSKRKKILTKQQQQAMDVAKKELAAAGLKDPQLIKEALDAAAQMTKQQKQQFNEISKQEKELYREFENEIRKRAG